MPKEASLSSGNTVVGRSRKRRTAALLRRLLHRIDCLNQLQKRRCRKRRRKNMPLSRLYPELAQENYLFEALHSFRNDIHAHVASESNQCFDDRDRVAVRSDGIDEDLVDLDEVGAQLEDIR